MIRIVCISDTHNLLSKVEVPDGDILIHAGDATIWGYSSELKAFAKAMRALPHKHKVFVAGNHEVSLEKTPETHEPLLKGMIYLRDSSVEIDGLKFYGSPWQPAFCNWAFNLHTREELRAKWDLIPAGTDVLITHGPPFGVLDTCPDGYQAGCKELADAVMRVRPKLHVFGHIHHSHGVSARDGTTFVNAAVCDEQYRAIQEPIVIDL